MILAPKSVACFLRGKRVEVLLGVEEYASVPGAHDVSHKNVQNAGGVQPGSGVAAFFGS